MFAASRTNLIRQLRSRENLLGIPTQVSSRHLTAASQRTMASSEPPSAGDCHRGTSESVDTATIKPPNIIIHHGDGGGQGQLRQLVTSVVSGEYYTVYDLPVAAPPVWLDSAALLVVAGRLSGPLASDVERFWRGGGAVLSLSSDLTLGCLAAGVPQPHNTQQQTQPHSTQQQPQTAADRAALLSYGDQTDVPCRYSAAARSCDVTADRVCDVTTPVTARRADCEPGTPPSPLPPAVLRCSLPGGGSGVALLCQLDWDVTAPAQLRLLRALLRAELGLHCASAAETEVRYVAGYLVSDPATAELLAADRPARHGPALRVVTAAEQDVPASADLLPLRLGPPPAAQFDWPLYRAELDTAALGRCLLYLPAVTSTMDVLREPRLPHGTVVVCDRQTRGRGRAGNTWLSPLGCCMLSARLDVALDSPLGGRLSWLQHVAALAVVEAVGDPRLGLKWPNDLYWAGRTKIGGVLVETAVTGRAAECRLGIGVNLDNAAPTACLNRLLAAPLARERLLARLLSRLERLLQLDAAELSRRYRRHWLHERQAVTVQRDGAEVAAEVCGLDPFGFLLVRAAADGAELAVSPDGNSFDMMRGLIVPKQAV